MITRLLKALLVLSWIPWVLVSNVLLIVLFVPGVVFWVLTGKPRYPDDFITNWMFLPMNEIDRM